MQEILSKIIDKLGDRYYANRHTFHNDEWNVGIDQAIKIVNQVAEEYKTVCNCTRLNDGWIPVSSGKLPEVYEFYLVTYQFVDLPKATCHELYYGADDGYEPGWYVDDEYTELGAPFNVIAWKPLPAPYQPKGE